MSTNKSNEHVSVSYYPKNNGLGRAYILVKDLKDNYNETTAYTRKVRGIDRAWAFIEQVFNCEDLKHDLNFSDITKILDDKFNLNTHIYCAMD